MLEAHSVDPANTSYTCCNIGVVLKDGPRVRRSGPTMARLKKETIILVKGCIFPSFLAFLGISVMYFLKRFQQRMRTYTDMFLAEISYCVLHRQLASEGFSHPNKANKYLHQS